MLYPKGLAIGGLCLLMSVSIVQAESYQCNFKPRRIEKDLIPASVMIDWPNYLKPARITDTIAQANELRGVTASVPIENSKRITFAWKLDGIIVPDIDRLTGDRTPKIDALYRVSIFAGSERAVLSVRPQIRIGYSGTVFRVEGRCKTLK